MAQVVGIEQNPRRAERVNRAENYISDVSDDELRQVVASGHLRAETAFARVAELDVIVICVPTPLTKNLAPDLSYIENVTSEIAARLRPGQLITLESTTYPGTTDEVMRPLLEHSGLKQGQEFWLAHSPERVDPGNQRYTTKNTSKVVGASDPWSLDLATCFYQQTIDRVVPVSSAKAAELVKVFENTFRAVNIALVYVSVYEGVILEDYVFCGPSMVFTNVKTPRSEFPRNTSDAYVTTLVKRGASIGANATIICGITLHEYAFVVAGAAVTKDVPAYAIVAGVPARLVGWMSAYGDALDFSHSDTVTDSQGHSYRKTGAATVVRVG